MIRLPACSRTLATALPGRSRAAKRYCSRSPPHTWHGPLRATVEQLEALPGGVIDADVFIGQAWAPAGVPTVGVVAMGAVEADARRYAQRLAGDLWRRRHEFDYIVPALDLDGIAARLDGIGGERLVIADSGDVPGAGAYGDRLELLELLLDFGAVPSLVAGVSIPAWIAACTGRRSGDIVEVRHPYVDTGFDATLVTPVREIGALGRCAVVAIRHVALLVVDRRGDPPEPSVLAAVDLNLDAYQVLVLKTGFIAEAYLTDRKPLLALSPGVTGHQLDARES